MLAAPRSALGTQHSALSTQHSALGTRHSALSTQHSALSTQHSALSTRLGINTPCRRGIGHTAHRQQISRHTQRNSPFLRQLINLLKRIHHNTLKLLINICLIPEELL